MLFQKFTAEINLSLSNLQVVSSKQYQLGLNVLQIK